MQFISFLRVIYMQDLLIEYYRKEILLFPCMTDTKIKGGIAYV